MPRRRPHADRLTEPDAVVLSCEHAGNAMPPAYRHLFAADPDILTTHRGYDIGILPVAKQLARMLDAPLIACRTSRLLIEVNRSLHHRALFSEFSRGLSPTDKQRLIEQIWRPHRQAVTDAVAGHIRRGKRVLHLALHSFTPVLDGCVRTTDVGLLYDPKRRRERDFALSLQEALRQMTEWRIRRNYPYRGNADGLTTTLRRVFAPGDYLGLEIELNQASLASGRDGHRNLAKILVEGIGWTWRP